jgi:hypothetical protein
MISLIYSVNKMTNTYRPQVPMYVVYVHGELKIELYVRTVRTCSTVLHVRTVRTYTHFRTKCVLYVRTVRTYSTHLVLK